MLLRYAAFTDNPASGNPAGVVLDASALSEQRMQEIAAELGYSEPSAFFRAFQGWTGEAPTAHRKRHAP